MGTRPKPLVDFCEKVTASRMTTERKYSGEWLKTPSDKVNRRHNTHPSKARRVGHPRNKSNCTQSGVTVPPESEHHSWSRAKVQTEPPCGTFFNASRAWFK
jgi:hypothetical protein